MTNHTFKAGESREQASLLPARVEDYVGLNNPVRAIESFVCALDLAKLGFRHADRSVEVGQPPYNPADLLKLYLYGYINQVRSSRRLEREACRNLELIWLLKNLKPGYRTIANFRKENWKALKAVNRSFVLLVRELGLIGGTVVAIDGSFFHGDASKASIFTRKRLAEQIANLDKQLGLKLDQGQRQWWCSKRGLLGDDVFSEYPSTPEEAFKVSTDGAYYAQQMLAASREGRITKVLPDRALLVDTWWDLGISDAMVIWFVQHHGSQIRLMDYYENVGEGLPH